MQEFLTYLLRVSVCLTAFYAFHGLFLRRSTFLTVNRVYLLAGLALSFVIPLLRIPVPAVAPLLDWDFAMMEPVGAEPGITATGPPIEAVHATPFPVWKLLSGIYLAGVFLLLLRSILSLFRIFRLRRRGEPLRAGRWDIRLTDGSQAFTFFRTIFLPRSGAGPLVLEHEKVHVRQGHTFDLLFMEVATVLLWFNPLVFLYRRALKLGHEYLADDRIVRGEGGVRSYLECMLDQAESGLPGRLTHAFGHHSLKKRIHMMTKNKTPRRYAWIYLLALPLAGAMTVGFAAYAEVPFTEKSSGEPALSAQNTTADEYTPSIYPLDRSKLGTPHIMIALKDPELQRPNDLSSVREYHRTNPSNVDRYVLIMNTSAGNVYATAPGAVVEASHNNDDLNYILIRHGNEYTTRYSRLGKFHVKAGDTVQKGQIIGEIRNSPHLGYEVRKNGNPVDPLDYLPQ